MHHQSSNRKMKMSKESATQIILKKIRRMTEDRISKLPDDVIFLIISFLPMKTVVRMSVLSKRWRYIWTLYPFIDFVQNRGVERDEFVKLVDHVLGTHSGEKLKRFCIRFSSGDKNPPEAHQWLLSAIQKGVEEIELDFRYGSYYTGFMYELPPLVFCCGSSITKLKLKEFVFDSYSYRGLPFLRFLCLTHCNVESDSVHRVLVDCPLLESLTLVSCSRIRQLRISAPNLRLKALKISDCLNLVQLQLYAPNLLCLFFKGNCIAFVFENISSLEYVALVIGRRQRFATSPTRRHIVRGLSCISKLGGFTSFIYMLGLEVPSATHPHGWFHSITELHLMNDMKPKILLSVLKCFSACPLEKLVIDLSYCWRLCTSVVEEKAQVRDLEKTVAFSSLEVAEVEGVSLGSLADAMCLLAFILEKATVLKSMIVSHYKLEQRIRDHLVLLPKASSSVKLILKDISW